MIYELQKFYYDTAQAFNPYTMPSFKKFVPVSQILFGTDYPLGGGSAAIVSKGLVADGGFTPAELRAIDRENALRLLPRLARVKREGARKARRQGRALAPFPLCFRRRSAWPSTLRKS